MPRDAEMRAQARAIIEAAMQREGLTLLGWRDLPVDSSDLGVGVREPSSRCTVSSSSAAVPT